MWNAFTSQAALAAAIVAVGSLVGGLLPVSAEQTGEVDPADVAAVRVLSETRGDVSVAHAACELATWPYLPAECLRSDNGAPIADVRWVTVEERVAENASALVRTPVAE